MSTPERVNPAMLRTLFLFEDLQEDQLEWVAEHGHVERYGAGAEIAIEGEPAEWFYILLSGGITLSRLVRGDDVEITRSDQPGVYAGATQFYLGDQVSQVYTISVRTTADSAVLALPAADFAVVFRQWYPMATHLLQGMFVGIRNADELNGATSGWEIAPTLVAGGVGVDDLRRVADPWGKALASDWTCPGASWSTGTAAACG